MSDEARAVPVEGDRERLATLLDSWLLDADATADALLRAGVSLTGSARHSPYECAVEHRIQTISGEHLTDDNCRLCSLTGSGLDVERLARAQVRSGIDTFLPGEDRWISANEAQAAIAREYAALSGESGDA